MPADLERSGLPDRVAGLLLGLAAGDRIGGPVRMALRVAESLAERGRFDAADIGERYLQWGREGAFDTGPTVARVLELVSGGLPLFKAAAKVHDENGGMTAGCNPAHRATPLAMCAAIRDDRLDDAAMQEALLTHHHPLAGDVAAAATVLCRLLIRGAAWSDAVMGAALGRRPETAGAIALAPPEPLPRGGFAPDVLKAAVYCVQTSGSFDEALACSIRFAGPANYSPVLVGSIGGARWGRSQIGEGLLPHHGELVPRLEAVAEALAAGWKSATPS